MKVALSLSFLVAIAGVMLWAVVIAKHTSWCEARAMKGIEKMCYETSVLHPGVSFKVYLKMRYIQGASPTTPLVILCLVMHLAHNSNVLALSIVIVSNDALDLLEKADDHKTIPCNYTSDTADTKGS